MDNTTPWSAQQLAEFLASVSVYTDEASALRGAVERASEAFEAEAAAIVFKGCVTASVGFPIDRTPTKSLVSAAAHRLDTLEITGVGPCHVVTVDFEFDEDTAVLLLARSGTPPSREEIGLLRSMSRVLALTVNNIRVVRSLRDRQAHLETLSTIQRLISTRAPLDDVLGAITRGMGEILGDDMVMLYFVDEVDASTLTPSFIVGVAREFSAKRACSRVGMGVAGRAVSEDEFVVIENYKEAPDALPGGLASGVEAMMAAPVHEHGQVIGALVVASRTKDRTFSASERELVRSFAEHASLAVTDSKTVQALQEAVGDAVHKAMHDPLTGLSNRTRFLDRLDHALAVRRQPGIEVSVLYVDIDDFKLINDRFGHAAGDRLLVDVAGRISGSVRGGDTVARLGGDEFAVLLEHTTGAADAQQGAARILEGFGPAFTVAHTNMSVSASIGIAMASSCGASSDDALRNADVAMYRAKNVGKGCTVVFEPGMYESLLDRIELEADLRRAVEDGGIDVYFQPIIDIETEHVVGVEALARWPHATRGFVPPTVFIPLAEDTGLIMELGRQVLVQACSWIGDWQQRHRDEPPLYVTVNVSAHQLQHPGFPDEVSDALANGSLAPSSLVLEITESVLVNDAEGTLTRLEELKRLGIRLALDDFGTGYSSLSYLRRFPVDVLKIDRSFVSALGARAEVPLIIEAIITLGDALGLDSVAEGVEQLGELNALRSVGCRLAQGFHFAKPMPGDALEQFLMTSKLAVGATGRHAG